jgi:hypothetical protein
MKSFKFIASGFILLFLFSFLVLPKLSRADTCAVWDTTGIQTPEHCITWNLDQPGLVNPLGDSNSDVEGLLHSIVNWLIKIGTPIAVGMILIGAFQMVFSGGDPEKFKRGKTTILYTAIGYAIILVGWGMTSIIRDFLSS